MVKCLIRTISAFCVNLKSTSLLGLILLRKMEWRHQRGGTAANKIFKSYSECLAKWKKQKPSVTNFRARTWRPHILKVLAAAQSTSSCAAERWERKEKRLLGPSRNPSRARSYSSYGTHYCVLLYLQIYTFNSLSRFLLNHLAAYRAVFISLVCATAAPLTNLLQQVRFQLVTLPLV